MDLTQAGDVLRLISNSKLHDLLIFVKLEEISRSGFVEELNKAGQNLFPRKSELRFSGASSLRIALAANLRREVFTRTTAYRAVLAC